MPHMVPMLIGCCLRRCLHSDAVTNSRFQAIGGEHAGSPAAQGPSGAGAGGDDTDSSDDDSGDDDDADDGLLVRAQLASPDNK